MTLSCFQGMEGLVHNWCFVLQENLAPQLVKYVGSVVSSVASTATDNPIALVSVSGQGLVINMCLPSSLLVIFAMQEKCGGRVEAESERSDGTGSERHRSSRVQVQTQARRPVIFAAWSVNFILLQTKTRRFILGCTFTSHLPAMTIFNKTSTSKKKSCKAALDSVDYPQLNPLSRQRSTRLVKNRIICRVA